MAILPTQFSRVSDLLRSNLASGNIAKTQQQLLTVQNQLSTGKRLTAPSDDPGASAIAQQLHKTLEQRNAYLQNLTQGQSQLGQVDTSLGDLTDLLQQAQGLASANVGSDVTPDQRQSALAVLKTLYTQALSVANSQSQGTYVFGGDSNRAPFTEVAGGVRFDGSDNVLSNQVDENSKLAIGVKASSIFGAFSAPSAASADLSPGVTGNTLLRDLRGTTGNGVALGSISVSDGTTTKLVDLSAAETVQDVVDLINGAGTGVTASLSATGVDLSSPGNVTVTEVGNGSTARDLGILAASGAGTMLTGQAISPKVTSTTTLSSMLGGAGLDTTGGLRITNGTNTVNVDFAGCVTAEDFINRVNSSGAGAVARINSAQNGIEIVNAVQGTNLSIAENGGTLATTLGVRSFAPTTNLSDLNNGQGVKTVAGADIQITAKDGTTFQVDLSNLNTVQDVMDAINTATGGVVTASFANPGNGIVLTDSSGGAGSLTVGTLNSSTAGQDLGIVGTTAGATIIGTDVNPIATTGIFGALNALQTALANNNQQGITSAAASLQAQLDKVIRVRGENGAHIQEMASRQSRMEDQNVATQALLSPLEDTDFTAAISQFQLLQTALQANLQTTAKVLSLSLMDFLR